VNGRILLACLLLCTPAAAQDSEQPGAADTAAARSTVESLHDVLSSCMREGDALGFQGRYDRILANLDEAFDLPFMARMSLGSYWKDLSEQEHANFTGLSRRLSATRYANNFKDSGDERFETRSAEPAARGTLLVKTELVRPADDNVRFDYRLRKDGERWRIIDVQLDARVSEIALRRAQYRSVIKREGFPELMNSLEEKIEELSAE